MVTQPLPLTPRQIYILNTTMQRYFMKLAYNGTAYHGWQIQPNGISVQGVLEETLSTLLRRKTIVIGAGRTDAGVHAELMVAHFDTEPLPDTSMLVTRLNGFLPKDIAIFDIYPVDETMHARFSAKSRTYQYRLSTYKDVFAEKFSLQVHYDLDYDLMNKAAAKLFDFEDFTTFSKLHTDTKTNICKIMKAEWEESGNGRYTFTIKADRFLRNMVRAIVGTLFLVGNHKMSVDDFAKAIEGRNRSLAGSSAPAKALFLTDVEY